tara:strand:- start:281 stop:865 length:585 start_codon:yes stop_codon:yes gene_type:complete
MSFSALADFGYAVRFLRLLTMKVEKTGAFKTGVIDKNYKVLVKARERTSEQKKNYTMFHRIVFNIKRLIMKVPGGKSTVGSYAAAMLLIKEHTGMSDKKIKEVIEEALGYEFDPVDIYESSWFMRDDELMPGTYMLLNDHLDNLNKEMIAMARTKIKVDDFLIPVQVINGINIYEVKHIPTGQNIYISNQDITR